jgi:hypothetical protein
MEPSNEYLIDNVIITDQAGAQSEAPALICITEQTWMPLEAVDAFYKLAFVDKHRWYEILAEIKEALEQVDGPPLEA